MFQDSLLTWYKENKRDLPWRNTSDPYSIWLSEIMLQQTQVATVIDYYNRFISKYPSVHALSTANEEDVFKLWEGLGYYSRAARLIPCARMIVEEYGGIFPSDYKDLLKLPGIGSYTAGAISSIAFNEKVPAVDGNVMRVYSRLFGIYDDISKAKTKAVFFDKVMETLPDDRCHFNQALMELGARVCTPKTYKCESCPINTWCFAFEKNVQEELPVKLKKIKKQVKEMTMAMVEYNGQFLVFRNDEKAMLKGLWGFPVAEGDINSLKDHLYETYNIEFLDFDILGKKKHVFTHQVWEMTLVKIAIEEKVVVDYPVSQWGTRDENEKLPWSTAQKKLWALI